MRQAGVVYSSNFSKESEHPMRRESSRKGDQRGGQGSRYGKDLGILF